MYEKDENIKRRQSYVSKEGEKYEDFVKQILESDNYIRKNALIVRGPKGEKYKKEEDFPIDIEPLKIEYNSNGITGSYFLDSDLIVYSKRKNAIVCVISVKKSFRERGGETAYWMVKKNESKKAFKYILVTPDNDEELFKPNNPEKRNKWRSILTAEMDGVFVVKEEEEKDIAYNYEEEFFKVGRKYLVDFIKKVV
ncbi:hypothetical protein Calkro_2540 [Caldicellulosiruptor kronotskyensis 2002]|uniref:BsaWI restriction endonuclease type 2 domain-containing protein n=1 Tax=Caldicellulosiruptor kronotskyensis (strain DSM 18902 / VKM B-2412 / 2002) TaxID=632348 RepID=E4SHW5_CALK2|nr:BsaWI family type II restriction enzyme [Caldicellulosiruptor kronotskyensis]ADQ47340.1 hypothetical protein Calkro_2540 [Caldicellulosiruptor kronotskyensis 2002]